MLEPACFGQLVRWPLTVGMSGPEGSAGLVVRRSANPGGAATGSEGMAQGPRLADVWDIDRKMALVFGAWIEMRQRLASYNAVAAAPWTMVYAYSTPIP